jgi:copper(I)-binding protein
MSRLLTLLIACVFTVLVAGCSSSAAPTTRAGGFISVYNAWARPADAGSQTAAYLTITNGQLKDDTLVGASSPVATSAGVHQTTTDASGMTGMQEAGSVMIRAGQDLVLQPGGYHVMLMGLTKALAVGDTFPLTLTFEQTGPVTVTVEVKAS